MWQPKILVGAHLPRILRHSLKLAQQVTFTPVEPLGASLHAKSPDLCSMQAAPRSCVSSTGRHSIVSSATRAGNKDCSTGCHCPLQANTTPKYALHYCCYHRGLVSLQPFHGRLPAYDTDDQLQTMGNGPSKLDIKLCVIGKPQGLSGSPRVTICACGVAAQSVDQWNRSRRPRRGYPRGVPRTG